MNSYHRLAAGATGRIFFVAPPPSGVRIAVDPCLPARPAEPVSPVSAALMMPRIRLFIYLGFAILVAGCGKPADDIRAYTVPREKEKEPAKKPAPEAQDKYRMLGAIIPAEQGYSWFVKFVGPTEVVSPLEGDFQTFVQSIRPDDKKPAWTAPPKWTEAPPRATRLATFKNGPAEMYLSGPFGGGLLENVNRWRKEVGLREVKETELKDAVTEIKLGDKTAYTVDLRGPTWSGGMPGMNAPFAGKR